MLNYLRRRFFNWRVNRYLKSLSKGNGSVKSLKRSFLNADELATACVSRVCQGLPEDPNDVEYLMAIGLGTLSADGLSLPSLSQMELDLFILGSLAEALDDESKDRYREKINIRPLLDHNWGMIRRATAQAVDSLRTA